MKALFASCILFLLSFSNGFAFSGFIPSISPGLTFVFVRATGPVISTEYDWETGETWSKDEIKEHRFTIVALGTSYGVYVPFASIQRNLRLGFDCELRVATSVSSRGNDTTSSKYYFIGGGLALLLRQGAGNTFQRKGFGFGGGLGIQGGLEMFSNEIVKDTYGNTAVRPQVIAEGTYSDGGILLTLRLYADILAKAGGDGDRQSSVRQAGFVLKYGF